MGFFKREGLQATRRTTPPPRLKYTREAFETVYIRATTAVKKPLGRVVGASELAGVDPDDSAAN